MKRRLRIKYRLGPDAQVKEYDIVCPKDPDKLRELLEFAVGWADGEVYTFFPYLTND